MSTHVIVYILTALAALVIVLTRVRLGRERDAAGHFRVGSGLLVVHTVAGVLALVVWTAFLVAPGESFLGGSFVGILGLALWWVVALMGLLILTRWLPTRGRHSSAGAEDTWSEGPGLSVLAHGGVLLGICVFTWAYLTAEV